MVVFSLIVEHVAGFGEAYEPATPPATTTKTGDDVPSQHDAAFYATCSLKDVENVCARNITMAQADGSIVRAPGVTVWIQAHCGLVQDETKRSMCVLSYIGDDFGDDQATQFFTCVCDECPRACKKQGNLRNRQNVIAMESQSDES